MLFPFANHTAPSDPAVIPYGYRPLDWPPTRSRTPAVVIRPIVLLALFVNHNAPSGPDVMAYGFLIFRSVYPVTTPSVVTRPMEPLPSFVNQSAPSEPVVISIG